MRVALIVGIFICLTLPIHVLAEPSVIRADIDSAFADGQYERVELLVLRAGSQVDSLSADEHSSILLTAGFAMIMLDRESDARSYFRKVLDLNPTTSLDPLRVSPKFRIIFDDVKANYRPLPATESVTNRNGNEWRTAQSESILLNLLLPGVGQWREGKRWRGGLLAGAQLAAVGILIWRLDELSMSRNAYVNETDRPRVRSAYDTYDRDTQWAWISGTAAVALYIGIQADLALFREQIGERELSLKWDRVRNHPCLALSFSW